MERGSALTVVSTGMRRVYKTRWRQKREAQRLW